MTPNEKVPVTGNKKALVMGVTNDYSIATGIARSFVENNVDVIYTYPNEKVKQIMLKTVQKYHSGNVCSYKCDVSIDDDITNLMETLKKDQGNIDYIIHSIAFADSKFLSTEKYYAVSREGFRQALDISCYSLTAIVREAVKYKLLIKGSSIITLSYYGAKKWIPFYNIMGVAKAALEASVMYLSADLGELSIRINAISPGPVRTLSAGGIKHFRYIGDWVNANSPLQKLADIDEIGDFVYAVMNTPILTGYTLPADCGYQIVGMKHHRAKDISPVNS